MGVFRKVKQSLGYHDTSLRERGTKGTAKVLSSKKTAMSNDDGDYVYKTSLLVTLPGTEPYEVDYKVEGGLNAGFEYPVYVDPDDHENIIVGDEVDPGEVMGRVNDALANMSNTALVDAAAMPVPGLTPELQQQMADNAQRALEFVKDPAQRAMLIAQYKAAGITVEDPDAT